MILFLQTSTGEAPSTFTPPLRYEIPRLDYMAPAIENRLSRHFVRASAATNVYKLVAGGYTENHPGDESLIEFTYFGGRSYVVDADEKAALISAGYSVT